MHHQKSSPPHLQPLPPMQLPTGSEAAKGTHTHYVAAQRIYIRVCTYYALRHALACAINSVFSYHTLFCRGSEGFGRSKDLLFEDKYY